MQLLLVGVPYNTVLVIDTVLVQIFIQRVLCGCCAGVTALKDEEDKKDLGGHTLTTRECMDTASHDGRGRPDLTSSRVCASGGSRPPLAWMRKLTRIVRLCSTRYPVACGQSSVLWTPA